MSMFDTVHYKGKEYQTKDLENLLTTYIVDDFGRLIKEVMRFYIDETAKGIVGKFKSELVKKVDTEFHGDIYIYNDIDEFVLRFTEGKLSKATKLRK